MALVDIGAVSRATGLAPSALRYYEEHGLLHSVARKGLRRQYEPEVVDRLAVILLCRDTGFTLAETAALLATRGDPGWKDLVRRKLDQTRRQAADLQRIAEGLDHALDCPNPNVLQCRHFRAELATTLAAHRSGSTGPSRPGEARSG
jgi:DNA-binding transcriptional MerR regulator